MYENKERWEFCYGQADGLLVGENVPHVTLWNLSKVDTQRSINLNVLSHICAALECTTGDLLEFVPDAEDEAIASVVRVKDAATKTAKKKGAREGKRSVR